MSVLDVLLGRPLASEEDSQQRVGVLAGVPTFGLDALASAAYGPEAALTILIPAAAAGIGYVMPISILIILLLAIVYFSYRQTIAAYPHGGGSYTVASRNLGRSAGLLAAAALMLDYLLDVGVGISTGVGALVSAIPSLVPHTLAICLFILLLLTIVSLRGVRENGLVYMLPAYLFVLCLLTVLAWGTVKTWLSHGQPHAVVPVPHIAKQTVATVGWWLLIRAFASGCTALTGVEAVSNGVMAFKEPTAVNARRTLAVIVALLAIFLLGTAHLTRVYGIMATEPGSKDYQSLLSMITAAVAGKGLFYYVTIGSILVLLSLSANTAFADFPRLCRAIAEDGYLPRFFAIRGRRLVYTEGILVLAILSGAIITLFGGITDRLIPLFAIGAFLSFTLSQAGMVIHWRREGGRWNHFHIFVNALGAVATGCTVLIVLVAKFVEGAWITVLMIPLLILLMRAVHLHYARVARQTQLAQVEVHPIERPLAIVPVSHWNRASQAALDFACSLTPDVRILHVEAPDEHGETASDDWQQKLDVAAAKAGTVVPKVVRVPSPFRFIASPIVKYVTGVQREYPGRKVAVVIPELVAQHWYQYLLHNYRSTALKGLLLVQGNRDVIVINVPWYLETRVAATPITKKERADLPTSGKRIEKSLHRSGVK
jgi:amino acid transporter